MDDAMGLQDLVVWKKLLTEQDIKELYLNGNWTNPSLHTENSTINDWWKFGYEEYWGTLGYSVGDTLTGSGGPPFTISSSYGPGSNDLTISSTYDQNTQFVLGNNPFGPARTQTEFFQVLSSSLSKFYNQ